MSYILCADDYAQSQPITEGILNLISAGKLDATTCMTTSPLWPEAAQALKTTSVQVGLHFNLTHGFFNERLPSIKQLLAHCFLRTVDASWVESQLNRQLDLFELHYGRSPDFIDGHEHVHHFPVIRNILINTYLRRYPEKQAWVRVSMNPWHQIFTQLKPMIIALTGAAVLRKLLDRHHIPHNNSFSGIYDFSDRQPYQERFEQFLTEISEGGLIMCHPGLKEEMINDSLAEARFREYQYLLKRTER